MSLRDIRPVGNAIASRPGQAAMQYALLCLILIPSQKELFYEEQISCFILCCRDARWMCHGKTK
jgi:hypothetical protein